MIYDCFSYWDEDFLLDLRLNILDKHIDFFVIVEGNKTWQNNPKKLKFDINKFQKFKDKIIYIPVEDMPDGDNPYLRENFQRNCILRGLTNAENNDLIIISDLDEIPNPKNLDKFDTNMRYAVFKQLHFYYKFNLQSQKNTHWYGSRICVKKYLKSPQWLRNIKDRKYSLYRFDVLFSETKFIDLKIIENGGWHFTNLKSAEEIEHKLRSYLHHREFDVNPISINEINNIIKNKIAIYDLTLDKRTQKIGHGKKLEKYPLDRLPKFLQDNLHNYQEWID